MTNKNNKYGAGPAVSGFELSGLVVATALVCTPAWSGETIEFDNGTTIDWTVTTSYGLGVRLSNPSSKLLTPNADDGDRNFDKGSLVTNRIGALAEMIVRKDNYGGVLRASTFYDDVYHRSNDNDSPGTVNKAGDHDEFTSDTKYYSGGRSKFLDAYVFSGWRFDNGSMPDSRPGGISSRGVKACSTPASVVYRTRPMRSRPRSQGSRSRKCCCRSARCRRRIA